MKLSDEQLMLLEQLTYLDEEFFEAIKMDYIEPNTSIEVFLKNFNKKALKELEEKGTIGYTQGSEWAAVIRAIKEDKELMNLKIDGKPWTSDGKTAAICFTDSKEPDKAIVAFRGTLDGYEWEDNVQGLNRADTKCQKKALDYIEKLPYSDITVVGHSKGGNKAQYVAIVSDKVKRCVSMDGQGFSKEFIDKYRLKILCKSNIIKNYSLDNDYVHILMFPVPGAEQIFCKGDGMENGLENHSQNSYFHYYTDSGWNRRIEYDGSKVKLIYTSEDKSMAYLHEFVSFVMNVMPDSDKEKTIEFLGTTLALAMDKDYKLEISEEVYSKKNLSEFVLKNPDSVALVTAYLLKYADMYHLTEKQVLQILRSFGLDTIANVVQIILASSKKARALVSGGEFLLQIILRQLKDGKEDKIIQFILAKISEWLKAKKIDFDIEAFWEMVEKEYTKIGDVDVASANKDATVRIGKTYNFSRDAYEKMLGVITDFEKNAFEGISSWRTYESEEWYDSLFIDIAKSGIERYAEKMTEINESCRKQIERIFNNAWNMDYKYAQKIKSLSSELEKARMEYQFMAEALE